MIVHAYLLFALLLISSPEQSASDVPDAGPSYDSALVDVNGLYVVVEVGRCPTADPNGSTFQMQLQNLVRTRLKESSVDVLSDDMYRRWQRFARLHVTDPNAVKPITVFGGRPVLRIFVDFLCKNGEPPIAYCVQTCFWRTVNLRWRNGSSSTVIAPVWNTDAEIELLGSSAWRDETQAAVLKQADMFLAAWKAALTYDPSGGIVWSATDSLEVDAVRALGCPYVASKSSSVFHSADCRMAGNIASDNLVGYNSREDAVAAGKRPCKTCNP